MSGPEEWEELLARTGFERDMKILVLGDGNMSFSVALARILGSMRYPGLLVTTTFDPEDVLLRKYKAAQSNVSFLRRHEWVRVIPGIDVRDITPNTFSGHLFDRVVFNFPYTGSDDETSNGDLLRKLFRNLLPILRYDAEVHLRLCNGQDEHWNVLPLVASCGFRVVARLPFAMAEFPGYERRKLESDIDWVMGKPITLISMIDSTVEDYRTERPRYESPRLRDRSPRHFAPDFYAHRRVEMDDGSESVLLPSFHSYSEQVIGEKRPRSWEASDFSSSPRMPQVRRPSGPRRPVVVKRSERQLTNVVKTPKPVIVVE